MGAGFRCTLGELSGVDTSRALGRLISSAARAGSSTHYLAQTIAWEATLCFLKTFAMFLTAELPVSGHWHLLFEFEIPRRGKRPDVVLIARDVIMVIEFKVGATHFSSSDIWQALSYALDLRDFHLASAQRQIVPFLVATAAPSMSEARAEPSRNLDGVWYPVRKCADNLGANTAAMVRTVFEQASNSHADPIDANAWESSPYRAAPSIINAAQQLFAGHGVANISHAFATNLDVTCRFLLDTMERARTLKQKIICFVTGIPGAGKTLAGLNAVHHPSTGADGKPAATFLSGNGPLVRVVRAALIHGRKQSSADRREAERTISAFIENVHRFIKTYAIESTNLLPPENVIVFDEAQRAWDAASVFRLHKVNRSEPQLILDVMERLEWSVVIALVGSGQEIYKGEAGISEWGRALCASPKAWHVCVAPGMLQRMPDNDSNALFPEPVPPTLEVTVSANLHLNVSVRSPRAKRISDWVSDLLSPRAVFTERDQEANYEFPTVLTRSLATARNWLRERSENVMRAGLLASSGALRLRADGIEVSTGFRHRYPYEEWYLAGHDDVRSSMALEVAATEFECQGLELDWTGICWGGDLLISADGREWMYRKFRGKSWQYIRQPSEIQFLLNKYRVLLTRARSGMVIWIPEGSSEDLTRDRISYDATADYLLATGIPLIA